MGKRLKWIRRIVAFVVLLVSLGYLLDVARALPLQLHGLFHLQLVPALLAGSWAILALTLIGALLFGRLYCSVICPLGILQDAISRLRLVWLRLSKRGKRIKTKYAQPLNTLRYAILGGCAVLFAVGISYPLLLLDPYSNFARITVSLFRPVVVWINNTLAVWLNAVDNYALYVVSVDTSTWLTIGFSAVVLAVLIVMVWLRERLWCNTICPVGTLLGLFSRFSLFRVSLDGAKCNSCKVCASHCKSRCIDSEHKTVDTTRCVSCYNCLGTCKRGAIGYRPTGWKRTVSAASTAPTASMPPSVSAFVAESLPVGALARRRFLSGSLVTLGSFAALRLFGQANGASDGGVQEGDVQIRPTRYPLPPGAVSLERFKSKCTACQLCISKCPTQVLQPAYLENGLTGMMQPIMKFQVERFCNFDCKVCTEVCPNDAIVPLSLEEKKLTQVGIVQFVRSRCVVEAKHQDCGACAEHCPTQAVRMVPFGDEGLTIPSLRPELCIGCGGCESICPVVTPAIFVEGTTEQHQAAPPLQEKLNDVEVTDFGF